MEQKSMKRQASPASSPVQRKKQCAVVLKRGDVLESHQERYRISEFLGKGSFGQVFRCVTATKDVALKYIVRQQNGAEQQEVRFLRKIRRFAEDFHLLKLYEWFFFNDHLCISVESLDCNLRQFINETGPLEVPAIRVILSQLLTAVNKLKDLHIIHTDVKPDNIMLIDRVARPYSIKLVDFGSSREFENTCGKVMGHECQTKWYRAPELILGLPCNEKMDIWSIGCVVAEMALGMPLYKGKTESEMVQFITRSHGIFEDHMLEKGIKVDQFFEKGDSWTLKFETAEVDNECVCDDLQELADAFLTDDPMEKDDVLELVHLLKQLLALDQAQRISADVALQSAFIKLSHMEHFKDTSYYESRTLIQDCCVPRPRVLVERQLPAILNRRPWKGADLGCWR